MSFKYFRFLCLNLLFLLISHPFASAGAGGGLSGSGGGSGVACFYSDELALNADHFLNQNIALPDYLLEKAQLNVLETWEQENHFGGGVRKAEANQSWEGYLASIKKSVGQYFPLFIYRLEQTAELTSFSTWEDVENLQLIEDATLIKKLPENCRRIQLVLRYSKGNNKLGDGPILDVPQIKIIFQKRYFDKLPVEDKAILMLHEQMYILGQAIGHVSSDFVRIFVRLFILDAFARVPLEFEKMHLHPQLYKIKYKLIEQFGDYLIFFSDTFKLDYGMPFTAQHHFATYLQFIKKQRSKIKDCLILNKSRDCKNEIMDQALVDPDISDEEAFMNVSVSLLERHLKINSDLVLDFTKNDPEEFNRHILNFCEIIKTNSAMNVLLISKSIQYCRSFKSAKPRK